MISRSEMQELLRACRQGAWVPAFEQFLENREDGDSLKSQALSEGSAGWWPLLGLRPDWSVLDWRCGWGSRSLALSRRTAQVVACDPCLELLQFLRLRADQGGFTNLRVLQAEPASQLPFRDAQFDLVILDESPELSEEAHRVLRPRGQLLLLAEGNHERKLRQSGFQDLRAFVPLPHLRTFRGIADPRQRSTISEYYLDHQAPRWKSIVARFLPRNYGWIAHRGGAQESYLEALGTQILKGPVRWRTFSITRTLHTAVCTIASAPEGPAVVVKLPSYPAIAEKCGIEMERLAALWTLLPGGESAWPEIPAPVAAGEFRGSRFFAQTWRIGRWGPSTGDSPRWIEQAVQFLLRLHRATRSPTRLDEAFWQETVAPHIAPGLGCCESLGGASAARLSDFLRRILLGRTWPLVLHHGDFWHGNLLFVRGGRKLTGVLDWDHMMPRFFPVLDLFFLLFGALQLRVDRSLAFLHGEAATHGRLDDVFSRFLKEYLQGMDLELSTAEFRALILLHWLCRLRDTNRSTPTEYCPSGLSNIRRDLAEDGAWLKTIASESL